jgi:nitrite reductase/ring-hydroxylating ferredoxin subunit
MKDKNKNINTKSQSSRRNFLKKIWVGLGALAGIELGVLTIGFLSDGRRNRDNLDAGRLMKIGKIGDFERNNVYPFRSGKFYLVCTQSGGFIAMSLNCTHLGCSVMWNEEKKEFVCPCHSSSFDLMGNVINPPAPRALDYYPVHIEKGELIVDVSKAVKRNSFDNSQLVFA